MTQIILALPEVIPPIRNVRSTLMLGSLAGLRDSGHFDRYVAALAKEAHEPLLFSVAGMWIPIEIAILHYRACDSLGLSSDSAATLGRATLARTQGALLGTALRLAKDAGVTPWSVFPHLQRFWLRGYDGGGVRVTKVGPKDARIDFIDVPLLTSKYYRHALRGLSAGLIDLFCTKAYVNERTVAGRDTEVSLRAQWV